MSFYEEEEAIGKVYDRRIAARLLAYLKPYRPQVIAATALMSTDFGYAALPPGT